MSNVENKTTQITEAVAVETVVRCTEIDVNGHLNNAKFVEYLEWGREKWYESHGFGYDRLEELGAITVVVNINLNYRQPCHQGDRLRIVTSPQRLAIALACTADREERRHRCRRRSRHHCRRRSGHAPRRTAARGVRRAVPRPRLNQLATSARRPRRVVARCRRPDGRFSHRAIGGISPRRMRSTTLEVDTELAGARKAALDELFDSQGPDGNQDRELPAAPRGRRRGRNPEASADGIAIDAIARDAAIQQGYRLHSASRLRPDRPPLKERASRPES